MRIIQTYLLYLLTVLSSFALSVAYCQQSYSNLRTQWLLTDVDSLMLDTLSIIPKSEQLSASLKENIDTAWYTINYAKAYIYFKKALPFDSIKITYRVFPFNLSKTYRHKDDSIINRYSDRLEDPFAIEIKSATQNIIDFGNLNYNGSFARDLSIGNNQNLVVNSNFNLQFSGKLKNDIEVVAAISDNSIPIQPEGNTAQLQEFDRIFMQFKKGKSILTLGDFEVKSQPGYFMRYLKKLQGVDVKTATDINGAAQLKMGGSLAIAKGKFTRNIFTGEEGNQGPYKLTGQQNELFIIILSGTERVYIDGLLLQRGATKDYTIDYNLGEVIFTPNQLITKDKRIVIEFEYAEQYYQKTLAQTYLNSEWDKLKLQLNFYSEQDSKNQPIDNTLFAGSNDSVNSPLDSVFQAVGNNIELATLNGFAPSEYLLDRIQYIQKDTMVYGKNFSNIFSFSADENAQLYNVNFTNVGFGMGDYVISTSLNNNRVYEWIAPDSLSGTSRGSYEPIIQLATPKRQQMLSLGADYQLNNKHQIKTELAFSNNDVNTFSTMGNEDNAGLALRLAYEGEVPLSKLNNKRWKLTNQVNYEWKQTNFDAIERYRPVEFKRDWNLQFNNDTLPESWLNVQTAIEDSLTGNLRLSYGNLISGKAYTGHQMALLAQVNRNNWLASANSSLVLAQEKSNTSFIRQFYSLSKTLPKWNQFSLGVQFQQEDFKSKPLLVDSLETNSFKFNEYQLRFNNQDSSRNAIQLTYAFREDFSPNQFTFERNTSANTFNLKGHFLNKNRKHKLNYNVTYRDLSYKKAAETQANERTVLAQGSYRFDVLKGLIKSSTLYEIGSGQQQKVEYTYAEVEAGQGNFSWTDYNENMIKEDDEFETAAFVDSARYVRLIVPTNIYVKTNSVKFNQLINVQLKKILNQSTKLSSFFSKFQLQGNYVIDRKNQGDDLTAQQYNPFYNSALDSSLIASNSNLKNALIFNRTSPVFSAELYQRSFNNKIALVSGFDQRLNNEWGTNVRYNITKAITCTFDGKTGLLSNNSDSFTNRVYDIESWEAEPALTFIFKNTFRSSISYRYKTALNINAEYGENEQTRQNELKVDSRYNILNKSSIHTTFTYDLIDFNGDANSSLAYTMLEGLQPGNNFVWSVQYDQKFKGNLRLGISYDGRKLGEQRITHTGRANFRAIF